MTAVTQITIEKPAVAAAVTELTPKELNALMAAQDVLLVDVRELEEYRQSFIPGAFLHPMSGFDPARFPRHAEGARVVFYCAVGKRSEAVARALIARGHGPVSHLAGGLAAWEVAGLETDSVEPLGI